VKGQDIINGIAKKEIITSPENFLARNQLRNPVKKMCNKTKELNAAIGFITLDNK
jgi:hypothetical protein